VTSFSDAAANTRPRAISASGHREQNDAHTASHSSEPSTPLRTVSGDQPLRDRSTNSLKQNHAAGERNTAEHETYRDDPAHGDPPPVATPARPSVQARSVTPLQDKSATPVSSEPPAKAREQERDDKDRH